MDIFDKFDEEINDSPISKLHDTAKEEVKKAVCVSVYPQGGEGECVASLEELRRLLDTAGAEVAAILTQMRNSPDSRFGIGSGKIEELSEICKNTGAGLAVFDFELTPSQIREIEDAMETDVSVLDRSMLILDIFATRAESAEGRLQVELAQLKYTAPRLMGKGKSMSRLGGGIGTRGPGETKLETDRRHLKNRISQLEEELRRVEKTRLTMRRARDRAGVPKCAIVGYTNAGKSTLLNELTGAGILAEDKLFATLDPTTRQFELQSGTKLLLTDTVGFIRNLPHHLIKAFKSTLDEAVYADALLIVADASDEAVTAQLAVCVKLLEELGANGKPTLFIFNKCDKLDDKDTVNQLRRIASDGGGDCVFISALTGYGMDTLTLALEKLLSNGKKQVSIVLPQAKAGLISALYEKGENVEVDYRADGIYVTLTADEKLRGQFAQFITEGGNDEQ